MLTTFHDLSRHSSSLSIHLIRGSAGVADFSLLYLLFGFLLLFLVFGFLFLLSVFLFRVGLQIFVNPSQTRRRLGVFLGEEARAGDHRRGAGCDHLLH
jgi:energy-converting hydrogenase Eha subunit G